MKKVWVEADHFFNGVDPYVVFEEVIDFLEESLPVGGGAAQGAGGGAGDAGAARAR